MITWFSFLLALALLLVIARKSLWIGLFAGAITIGLFNLPVNALFKGVYGTLTDIPILLLAISVGTIPIIGRALQTTGLLGDLVNNLQMKRKVFLVFSPAFMGLLPLPGGALLSAPMLIKAGDDISSESYVAINVWFRHILILIYPLGALLPCAKMAGLNLYSILIYIFPTFILLSVFGYIFLLRKIQGNMPKPHKTELKKILIPIFIIISAPIVHVTLTHLKIMDEISLLIGISTSLILTVLFGKMKLPDFKPIILKMKPWRFFLIIIGIFLFLNIFKDSEVSEEIAKAVFSKTFLIIIIAAFLGFVTGRIQLPVSILLPIYLTKFSASSLNPFSFAIMYSSVFIGYMLSPVHPCVSVSIEFFDTTFKKFLRKAFMPGLLSLIIIYFTAIIFL
jgi:integral membrane protein (TIGR00529 family)